MEYLLSPELFMLLAFYITIIFVLIKPDKKKEEHYPLTFDDSHKYVKGYNRAKQIISDGSDADQLLKMSDHEEGTQSEWLRGYRQACTDHIKKQNKIVNKLKSK